MEKRIEHLGRGILLTALTSTGSVYSHATAGTQPADRWFEPDPTRSAMRTELGLMGRVAENACLVELFHETPDVEASRDCVRRLLSQHHERVAAADADALTRPEFPHVWVISSGISTAVETGFGLSSIVEWPVGCLAGPAEYGLRWVVVRRLRRLRETLLLRLMGKGSVLTGALEDLTRLSDAAVEWKIAVPEVMAVRSELMEGAEEVTPEERRFMKNTEEIAERWRKQAEGGSKAP